MRSARSSQSANAEITPVIPANAGIQCLSQTPLGPRVRGDDHYMSASRSGWHG